jgi:hypothetical protein
MCNAPGETMRVDRLALAAAAVLVLMLVSAAAGAV